MRHDAAIVGPQKAQHAARMLVEEVEIGRIGGEQRGLTLERCAYGLETVELPGQRDTALLEFDACLETVAMLQRLNDEIAREPRAEKQHKCLPGLEPASIMIM